MGTTKDQLANLVMADLEMTREITGVDTETSTEASLFRRHYDRSRIKVLEDFPLPEATRYAVLALVANTPNDDWAYAYRAPVDCLFARRLTSVNGRKETAPPPFRLGSDAQGTLVYCNITPATLEYTVDLKDPGQFSSAFEEALAWKIAEKMSGISRMKDAKSVAAKMYVMCLSIFGTKAMREQQQYPDLDSEMMRARV